VPNYTYPGTDTVKNKLGARTHDQLEEREAAAVFGRDVEIRLGEGPKGQFDAAHLKAIHRHLFQDVYEWAGRTRDEQVRLSDGTIATEPLMNRAGGGAFLAGPLIPAALDDIARRLREAGYLRGLSPEAFAVQAADTLADLNAVHPFREGNGRAQRTFVRELAKEAGHDLDFSVISKERMVQASIAANEWNDPTVMHRLFRDALDPGRVAPLREGIAFLERQNFSWNETYIATVEPGHRVEVVLVDVAGAHFMARTASQILIGNTVDLPDPPPESGQTFILDPGANRFAQPIPGHDDQVESTPAHDDGHDRDDELEPD
jgi:cell filamentation protein